ncbi:Citrinin biosynthesis cluster MFS transporter mrr1 [Pseudocercospora fuligena]|uniref:Citrinin biosynthesis cluster MFS transporter mrr1 n=1 Tax=Pseudocercospora fuligena TaxID=685502 RepID=A0A8H6VPN4_9PEZI|nr:Citrinin biosynthesis cluster MFS transporter mrr1 [Pseudocercospora fuligena]
MSDVEDVEGGRGRKWQSYSSDSTPVNSSPNPSLREKEENEVFTFEENDKRNPYNWSNSRKWLLAGISLAGTLFLPLNGTSITIAAAQLGEEFNVSDTAHFTNTYWAVTSWSVGGAVFIILFLPLLEELGVRRVYLGFYLFFILMVIPQALAHNFATLVVTRFFSGGCVALLANSIVSIIPDLWEGEAARSLPVGIYIVLYVVGSTLGPVVFAPIVQYDLTWRWIFYTQLIMYGVLGIFFLFFLPETRGHIILRRAAKKLRKQRGRKIYSEAELNTRPLIETLPKAIIRPTWLLVTEPVLLASTLWSAFALGTIYAFTQSVEQVFKGLYGWESYKCGYVQAAVVIGEILGWFASIYGTRLFLKSADRNPEFPGQPIPEARLYVSIFASFLGMTGGMFVYGWTSYSNLPWIVPAIGLGLVGFGIQVVVGAIADYIVDAYANPKYNYAGSAISAVAAGENIVAGFLPLASQSMYTNLGFHWASSLLGFLALGLSCVPIVFLFYGRSLRERSTFMQSAGKDDSKQAAT